MFWIWQSLPSVGLVLILQASFSGALWLRQSVLNLAPPAPPLPPVRTLVL